jgi:hypothetical protein
MVQYRVIVSARKVDFNEYEGSSHSPSQNGLTKSSLFSWLWIKSTKIFVKFILQNQATSFLPVERSSQELGKIGAKAVRKHNRPVFLLLMFRGYLSGKEKCVTSAGFDPGSSFQSIILVEYFAREEMIQV